VEGRSVEDVSKRTAKTRTWNNFDGSFTTRVSPENRFYQAGDRFEPIDNTLIHDDLTGYRNKANSFVARFRSVSSGVALETPEGTITMTPLTDSQAAPEVDDKAQTITYRDVWPGVDLRYRVVNDGVKEEVALRELPTVSRYSFRVEGTSFSRRSDGGLAASGAFAGKWEVAAPVVFDKHGSPIPEAGIRYHVDGDIVTLTVNDAWRKTLTKSDLPVVLDPSVNHVGTQDLAAYKKNDTDNFGAPCAQPCQVQVGLMDGETQWRPWRTTAHFAYEHLYGQTLTDARLVMQMLQNDCCPRNPQFGHTGNSNPAPLPLKVYPGQTTVNYGGDWNWANLNPAGPLGTIPDVQDNVILDNDALLTFYQGLLSSSRSDVPLKIIGDETVGNWTYKRWFYFEMEFTYNGVPSVARPVSPPSPPNQQDISTTTPTFQVLASDPDGDQIWYWYQLCLDAAMQTNCQTSGQWITATPQNPNATWTPSAPLNRGTTYYWRAYSSEGGTQVTPPDYVWSFRPAYGYTVEKTADKAVYNRGDTINYTITIANPTASPTASLTVSDSFPAELVGQPGLLNPSLCPGCNLSVSGLTATATVAANSSVAFTFPVMAGGIDRGCSVVWNGARAYQTGVSENGVWGSAPVTICGGGLGIESWWTYVDHTLGPQATARVNVANGNLVVQQTDSVPVPGHGRLGYVLRRTYNSQAPGNLDLLANSWGQGWMLNIGAADDPSGLGLATELVVSPSDTAANPGAVIYIDRDGTQHVFKPRALTARVDATASSTAALGALVPKVLAVASSRICATHVYDGPRGVHLALWRYVSIPSASSCSTVNLSDPGVTLLGFGAMRPDRVRYEFGANGQLLSMVDGAGVELRYLYENTNVSGVGGPLFRPLKAIYEHRSCSGDPTAPGSTCRAFVFKYPSATQWQVIDPAKRTTTYTFDSSLPTRKLVRVDNPSGSNTVYGYGSCKPSGEARENLCSVSDPNGAVTHFDYEDVVDAGWPDRLKAIHDRRTPTATDPGTADVGFTYLNAMEVRVDQGSYRRRYLLNDDDSEGTNTSGRVNVIEEGGTGEPVAPLLRKTAFGWEEHGFFGCTGPGYDWDDYNLCGLRRTGSLNGVSSPDEYTTWTYTSEGLRLTESRTSPNGNSTTTWGYRVQYAQADGTVRCLDYRTTGNGWATDGSPSCNYRFDGETLYAISDNTEMLSPRGNRPVSDPNPGTCDEAYAATEAGTADPDCYRTTYLRDVPAPTGVTNQMVSVNPTKAPTATPCGGTVGNTGLVCESRQPTFDANGAPTTTRYTYDLFGQRATMTTPKAVAEGQTASSYRYTYYDDTELDLSGGVSAGGWLKAVTDPSGNCNGAGCFVAFGYDRGGNAVRTWDRNATNGLTVAAFPSGAGAGRPFAEKRYSSDSDAYGKPWRYLVSETDPLGNKTSYRVDSNGNRTAITPPRGTAAGGTSYDIVQTFGPSDLLLTRALPGETASTNQYDVFENLVTLTDPVGNKTVHRYDVVNRPTETRWQRGPYGTGATIGTGCHPWESADAPISSNTVVCMTTQRYDGVDRVVEATDGRGARTVFTFDSLGREVRRVVPRSATEAVRADTIYDLDGNVIGICLPRQFTATAEGTCSDGPSDVYRENRAYDQAGRLVRSTRYRDGGGARIALTTTYSYDADGNLTRRDDPQDGANPNDDRSTSVTFDLLGRKKSERVARSATVVPETQWNYDAVGNVTSIVRPGAAPGERVTAYQYDAANRRIRTVEGSDNANAAAAGSTDVDGGKNIRSGVAYDADGHVVAQFEPRAFAGGTTPDARFMVRTDYDVDGRPVAQWVPRYGGTVTDISADTNQKVECPEIDPAYPQHRPASINGVPAFPDGTGVCLSRAEYDDAGRVIQVILPTAGWNRSATGPSTPANTNRYVTYSYTGDNLIATETAPSPQTAGQRVTTAYTYNGAGQPERVDRPGGRSDTTKYSLDGLIIETTGMAGEVPHVQTFQYDQAGNKTRANRTVNGAAEYDTWTYSADNLVAEYVQGVATGSAGNKTSYEYDLVGNPLRVYSPAANACHATNCPAGASRGTPTRYSYTLDNLVQTATVPVASNASSKRETTYIYDLGGRKTEQAVRMLDGTDVSFVGAGTIPAATVSVSFVDLPKPTGTTVDDVMLASIVINDSSPTTVIVPTGWTVVRDDSISGSLRQIIYRKTAGIGDATTTNYRWSLGTTRRMTGGIQTFRGVNATTPVVDHNATVDTTADPDVSAPPVNGLRGGILVHFAAVNGEGTLAAPVGMDESWETTAYNPSDTRDVLAEASRQPIEADGLTVTRQATTTASGGHIGAAVSLRPAVPGTPDPGPPGVTLVNKTSSTSGNSAVQSLSIARPAGVQAGDLLVAQIVSNDDDPDIAAPIGPSTTNPGPWVLLNSSVVTDALRQNVFVRKATSDDVAAASYTFTLTTTTTRRMAGGIAAYHGADTTNLAAIPNAAATDNTSGTTVTAPSVTAAANSRLLQLSAIAAEGQFTAAPSGMTEIWDQSAPNSSNTRDVIGAAFDGPQTTAGSTGTKTSTSLNPGKRIGALLVVAPAPSGPAGPSGSTSQKFTYYPNDRLELETGRNNEQIRHRYDAAGNPIEDKDVASGHAVTSDYYLDGLPRTVSSGIGATVDTTAYGYNGAGLPISRNETGTQAQTTKYRYNDSALIDQLTSSLETAGQWTWTYDTAGRPLEENAPNGYKVTKTWRGDDTLATQRLVNNAQTILADWTYHHDELYRQKSQDFAGKDANGAQTTKNFSYTYWPTGELKTFNDGTTTKNVTWDPDGNRTAFGNITASYNADDSVKSVTDSGATATFEYLPFGGVLRDGSCNAYDGFDRLTSTRPLGSVAGAPSCADSSPTPIGQYAYDAVDRQRSRTAADGKVTTFRYDGRSSTVAGEKRDTAIINYLLNPGGAAEAVTQTGTAGTEFLFDDGFGNVATVTKDSSVKCAVRYSPFGEPVGPQGSNACGTGSTLTSGFYRGERRDETTGRYQLGSRTYDPKTSSFLTPDSYRKGGSAQNLSVGVDPLTRNGYSYVNGDPINLVDPDGHAACGMASCAMMGDFAGASGPHIRTSQTATGTRTVQFSEAGVAFSASEEQKIPGFGTVYGVNVMTQWLKEHGTKADYAYQEFMERCRHKRAACEAAETLLQTGDIAMAQQVEINRCKQDAGKCSDGAAISDELFNSVIETIATMGTVGGARAVLGRFLAGRLATTAAEVSVLDDVVSASRWSASEFKGLRVYQRNDLINPDFIDQLGRTNLQRMQRGLAPIGPDGNPVNLHHMLQTPNGPIAEVTQTFHQTNSRVIHINPSTIPSGIDRSAFDAWRSSYWMWRAQGF
jgi:RHS repeat-associated protein/uncharacterized repeat protein (TIGR01451 family)